MSNLLRSVDGIRWLIAGRLETVQSQGPIPRHLNVRSLPYPTYGNCLKALHHRDKAWKRLSKSRDRNKDR